jgi:death on curing protein
MRNAQWEWALYHLARLHHRWAYEPGVDLADLAAAYGYGLIRNHGYIDGNKRIGFVALAVFLDLNGWEVIAPEPDVVTTIVAVAAGTLSEPELAAWVRAYIRRLEGPSDSVEEPRTENQEPGN